jgi:hypothetical protein
VLSITTLPTGGWQITFFIDHPARNVSQRPVSVSLASSKEALSKTAVRRSAPVMSAAESLAQRRSASLRFAPRRSAPLRSTPQSGMPRRLAILRSALRRSALTTVGPSPRFPMLMFAPLSSLRRDPAREDAERYSDYLFSIRSTRLPFLSFAQGFQGLTCFRPNRCLENSLSVNVLGMPSQNQNVLNVRNPCFELQKSIHIPQPRSIQRPAQASER